MRYLLLSVVVVCMVGIMIPNAFAEITITDDATGGGCTTIGTWDSASKTCTLTYDVSEPITIDSDGITLDGNNHTVTMPDKIYNQEAENGISSSNHKDITIKNFNIVCPENYNCGSGVYVHGQTVSDSSLDTYGTLNVDNITIEQNNFSSGNWPSMCRGIWVDVRGWANNYVGFAPPVNLIIKNNYFENVGGGGADYCGGMSVGTTKGAEIFGNTIIWSDTSVALAQRGNGIESGWSGANLPENSDVTDGIKIYDNVIDGVNKAFQSNKFQKIFENEIKNVNIVIDREFYGGEIIFSNNNILSYGSIPTQPSTNVFPGNYWAGYDTENEGCTDTDYDNICDTPPGFSHTWSLHHRLDYNPWNIPNGWDTAITTNESITDQEATSNSGAAVTFSAPVAEKSGQSVPVTCSPSSGSIFSLGTTQVICQTSEGRTSVFTITVSDTLSPTITVPNDLESHTSVPQGIVVEYSSVTASDAVGLSGSVLCDVESGTLFPIGENIVTCTATDTSGNVSTATFTINVISDVPLPVINVPNDIVVEATSESGTYVNYPAVTATDSLGIAEGPTCNTTSGNPFYVGSTTVTCTATNTAGFVGTGTFTITVNPFIPPPMIVDVLLPTNGELERGWSISNERGDQSYTSSGVYIQGYEKKYVRTGGYGDSVVLSAAVFQVTGDSSAESSQEIADDERDRNFTNARDYNTPAGYSNFSPWGFPSECEGIEEDFDLTVRITAFCLTDDYYYSVIALASAWDVDDDIVDFTKVILNKIGVAPEPEVEPEAEIEPEVEEVIEPEVEEVIEPEVEEVIEPEVEEVIEPEVEEVIEPEVEEVIEPEVEEVIEPEVEEVIEPEVEEVIEPEVK